MVSFNSASFCKECAKYAIKEMLMLTLGFSYLLLEGILVTGHAALQSRQLFMRDPQV